MARIRWYVKGIRLDLDECYGQFNLLHHAGRGAVP